MLGFVRAWPRTAKWTSTSPWAQFAAGSASLLILPPANEPQPPLRNHDGSRGRVRPRCKSHWQSERASSIAINCTACHGETRRERNCLYPTLASMKADTIYKQLDDFPRQTFVGAMTQSPSAFAPRFGRRGSIFRHAEHKSELPQPNDEQHVSDTTSYSGNPARGIAAVLHVTAGRLQSWRTLVARQQPDYIESSSPRSHKECAQNDINEQMRTIATPARTREMRDIADITAAVAKTVSDTIKN